MTAKINLKNVRRIPAGVRPVAITRDNFKRVCGLNGFTPEELITRIERHKTTVYKALKNPAQFGPTYRKIQAALPIREVPHV